MAYNFGPPRTGDNVRIYNEGKLTALTGIILEVTGGAARVKLDLTDSARSFIASLLDKYDRTIHNVPSLKRDIKAFTIWLTLDKIEIIGRTYFGGFTPPQSKLRPPSYYLCKPDNIKSSWKDCAWKPTHLR